MIDTLKLSMMKRLKTYYIILKFVWIREWIWESEFEMIWKESIKKLRLFELR